MCSGRVDLEHVLRSFSNGSDAVFIGGCNLDECNYLTQGNYHALNMVHLCKKIMECIGLNPKRLRIEFMSAGDGIHFAEVMDDFGEDVKELGPLGSSEGVDQNELRTKIDEVRKLIPYIKVVKKDKLAMRFKTREEYDGLYTGDEVETLLGDVPSYYIDPDKCRACGICFRRCPAEAIAGGKKRIHVIEQEQCIKCGTCFEVCPPRFGAVQKITGEPVPPPLPEKERMIVKKKQEK